MEGVGSRLGRASSRYGSSTTAAVFNGPVRKWKKKWIPSTAGSNHNSHSNGRTNNNSRLLLFRWTTAATAASGDTSSSEEPPKRKFRYIPVAVLEERRKAAKKVDAESNVAGANQFTPMEASKNDELNGDSDLKVAVLEERRKTAKKVDTENNVAGTNQFTPMETSKNDELNSDSDLKDSNMGSLDLGLCLKVHNSDHDSVGENNDTQMKNSSSGGFWPTSRDPAAL